MLHHISITVNNPHHVASVLAEIMQGDVIPFPPNPGSYVALAEDEFGTMIELYPTGTEMIPNAWEGQAGFQLNEQSSQYSSVFAAISVPISLEEIERIGAREGWRVFAANRDGLFDVVEFWIENRLMLELLTPAISFAGAVGNRAKVSQCLQSTAVERIEESVSDGGCPQIAFTLTSYQ